MRFPAVSGKAAGFPRRSRGPERHSRSLPAVMADCGGKNAARSLAHANRFPADFIPADRDGFACRQRPVRIRGRRRRGDGQPLAAVAAGPRGRCYAAARRYARGAWPVESSQCRGTAPRWQETISPSPPSSREHRIARPSPPTSRRNNSGHRRLIVVATTGPEA
jgi:hypothetical protein